MKKLSIYYIALFFPLLLLAAVFQKSLLPAWLSISLLLLYVLLYRTWLDGQRLIDKGLINKQERWKVITHGLRAKYFRELYLDK
ncbi:hypothetical protein FHG64_09910 [Antarcticibacterium flavum]|uniref:Uncharacterized protein n=1 Tax=Antarcticibacterium flavum TaxID=2058175 RepID=A0A5B7X4P4_9FLAO|nr:MULTISPECIES: hypothetical protein [Antarcticibacterium]MCM4160135.1 hypothetical protein [Antarcticibacterium sp. W02-3]QCY69688.1 hypothetical protein FHG64_09910 [Antarcticibacterium flavum]